MGFTLFQKGRFYTLPISAIRDEDSNSYFIVSANDREYAIRMFEFQRQDPEVMQLTQLPCMVKDIHGENIVFVQNFAEMFGNQYDPAELYQFVVVRQASTLPDGQKYYDVHDERGVPFRLKTRGNIFLQPNQKINCRVVKTSRNKLQLIFEGERKQIKGNCVTPSRLLAEAGIDLLPTRIIARLFKTNKIFSEARKYLERNDAEWVIKALLAVPGVEEWGKLHLENRSRLLEAFNRLCLYVLEDSTFLMQFSESERENFQEWIAGKVQNIETYKECLELLEMNREGEEIDNILRKIHNVGYIYKPQQKMTLLIAIFSMKPEILEERIDMILDIIAKSAKDWKLASFKKAFSGFMQFYIMTNRDTINREAFIEDDRITQRLHRMVRAICYLLLMTEEEYIDVPLYKSMLYHYLSFVRCKNVLGQQQLGITLSDSLVEQAFQVLFSSDSSIRDISWDKNFGQTELFAFQMSQLHRPEVMLTTRSYESECVRFTVSNEGIILSRTISTGNERNVLPADFLNWHNIQIYLDNPTKYPISRQSKITTWSNWWKKVEAALFEKRETPLRQAKRKLAPEVGTEVMVRVLRQDTEHPNRFYCRIEDDVYQGEGRIETYMRGAGAGLFRYDPQFDIDSFYLDGKPLLFKVRVNAINGYSERSQTYSFDALSLLDQYILDNVEYLDESDCKLIFHDERNHVMLGITEYGYGIFVPDVTPDIDYKVGDTVHVRLTGLQRVQTMQGEVLGLAEEDVNVRDVAQQLLQDYADNVVYEESAAELAEAAMAVAEDQFNVDYISQMICILDYKAVVESDNSQAYGYLSVAYILAGMIDDKAAMRYLDQRRYLLCVLEDYGTNGKVDEDELEQLSMNNADLVEKFPVLKQRLCEIRIVNSFGKQENNGYLWELAQNYGPGHIVGKLARLMLSYNMADGFGLQEHQNNIIAKIKLLLGINIELPKIYSFGEEDQMSEFKSSIVYPPNNGMQPNLQEQTFNIMKVICGMVNAYGGTVYLGVYDTGTAKGLEDDLRYFDNSRDKFDLYVRNQIRYALGDTVNASVVVEHPEAGKHWVYAIKVNPSKSPVMLRLDNRYYLREGSSTYAIDDVDQLREIMDSRDFTQFNVEEKMFDDDPSLMALSEVLSVAPGKKGKGGSRDETPIATSLIRSNITNNWDEGYGENTFAYLRIHSWGDWCLLKDVEWEDGLLTLAIHDDEVDGYLIVVYEDGEVIRFPLADILQITPEVHHKMAMGRRPIFVSPARKTDALLTAYYDEKGKRFLRLDDISKISSEGKDQKVVFKTNEGRSGYKPGDSKGLSKVGEGMFNAKGVRLTDTDFRSIYTCDIIPSDHHASLKRMHNLRRSTLGFPVTNTYIPELNFLIDDLGINI